MNHKEQKNEQKQTLNKIESNRQTRDKTKNKQGTKRKTNYAN